MSGSGFELGTDGPTALVVGVDGSDSSMRAAAYAAGLCRRQRSRLVLVYVREVGGGFVSAMDSTGVATAAAMEHQDSTERMLGTLVPRFQDTGVTVELLVRAGEPYQVLASVAQGVRADGVVVGSSTSVGHRIAGSLALRLVRHAKWPVTVVP